MKSPNTVLSGQLYTHLEGYGKDKCKKKLLARLLAWNGDTWNGDTFLLGIPVFLGIPVPSAAVVDGGITRRLKVSM